MGRIRFLLFFREHDLDGSSFWRTGGGLWGLYAMFSAPSAPSRSRGRGNPHPAGGAVRLAWLVGCVVTQLEIVNIANGRIRRLHLRLIAGQVLRHRQAFSARWSFIAMHLLLIPAVYSRYTCSDRHYRYQAYMNETARNRPPDSNKRYAILPALVWDELSKIEFQNGNRGEAWRLVVEGLHHNRSNEHALKLARDICRA
jgi:hypothetical protein